MSEINEIQFIWADKKMHTISINADGEKVNLNDIYKKMLEVTKDNDDFVKNLGYLYIGLLSGAVESPAYAFILGWIMRSIKSDNNWIIDHSERDVPADEAKKYAVDSLRKLADYIETDEKEELPTPSIPKIDNGGSFDGSKIFG